MLLFYWRVPCLVGEGDPSLMSIRHGACKLFAKKGSRRGESLGGHIQWPFSAFLVHASPCALSLGHSLGEGVIMKIDKRGVFSQIINLSTYKFSIVYKSPFAKHWSHRSLFLHYEIASRFIISLILEMGKLRFRETPFPKWHRHLHSHDKDPFLLTSVRFYPPTSAKNLGKYPIKVPTIKYKRNK